MGRDICFIDTERAEMYCTKCFLSWRDVAGLWYEVRSTGLQLLSLAALCSSESSRSAPVSLGLGPRRHLGHREKECGDLMMYRKSEEPHKDPAAAIGQRCASESPAHSDPPALH